MDKAQECLGQLSEPDLEKITKVMSFMLNPKQRQVVELVFPNTFELSVNLLVQIHDNWKLFKIGVTNAKRMFTSLDAAVTAKRVGDIILHFGKIRIYAIMTPDEYNNFVGGICLEGCKDEIYQIILLSERQKVVLLCDRDPEFIQKLVKDADRGTYKLQTRSDQNQLEIKDQIVDNYKEGKKVFKKLAESLVVRYPDIDNILRLIKPPTTSCVNKFIELLMSGNFECRDKMELLSNLGTIVIVNQAQGSIMNNGTINGSVTTNINQTDDNSASVRTWITQNPPGNMSKEVYYQQYRSANQNPITKNKFSVVMMSVGYVTYDNGKPRKWRLKQ